MPGQVAVLMGAAYKIALESCLGAVFGVRCQKKETSSATKLGKHDAKLPMIVLLTSQWHANWMLRYSQSKGNATNNDAAPNGVIAILNSILFYGAPDNISLR